MSFLSGILDVGRKAIGFLGGDSLLSGLARTAILAYGVNKLSSNALKGNDTNGTANIDNGVRLQINPDATAKIPVLYGQGFFGGNISDAAMTNNNKTMWYSLVLSEKTGDLYSDDSASAYTFNEVYWNNQRIVFDSDGVTVDYTVDTTGVIDRSLSGLVKVYLFAGDSETQQAPDGYSITSANAYDLFPNWGSGTHAMDNLVFALVRVDYSREKNVTGLGNMLFQVTNSLKQPGDVFYDFMTNTTYGVGISASEILTTDVEALNTYSLDNISYDDEGTGAETLADRYQINGLIDTQQPVLTNAEKILSAAGSWLSYDTHSGEWGIVINKADSSIASFNDSNILGNVRISGTGLEELYNTVKVEFPHRELRDSADFYNISLDKRNANEETNTLNLVYDIINEPIQAQMLALIELKQSRLDRVIQFETDFSYYNLKAGDIIDVTDSRLGLSSEDYRIVSIEERQDNDGALKMDITALQYDANVYSVADLFRFTRSDEDGIITIGSIGVPGTPVVTKFEQDVRPRVEIESTAPTGIVEGMEFWLTTDVGEANDADRSYTLIATRRPVNTDTFTSGTIVSLDYDALDSQNFFIKTRGINTTTTGPFSTPSGLVEYTPTQVTNAIDADTAMYGETGGLLTGLALVQLADKLLDLFGDDTEKSIFEKVFDAFTDETGVDLVGQANDGDLVVESNLETKSDGGSLGATTSSIDFTGGLQASGSGDVTASLIDGTESKDIVAWNADEGDWQILRAANCLTGCEFVPTPPPGSLETECFLEVTSTLPSNSGTNTTTVCKSISQVPYQGSYFITFSINPGYYTGAVTAPENFTEGQRYKIITTGNVDFTLLGAANSTVGTVFTATGNIQDLIDNGDLDEEFVSTGRATVVRDSILADEASSGTTYIITQLGNVDFTLLGANVNEVGTIFTATTTISALIANETLAEDFEATGYCVTLGPQKANIPQYSPLEAGVGNVYLYGSDGELEQTLTESDLKFFNNVVELPFADRTPGKDYYITFDEGIVIGCDCENVQNLTGTFDTSSDWAFRTSMQNKPAYVPNPGNLVEIDYSETNYDFFLTPTTITPLGEICDVPTDLEISFSENIEALVGFITVSELLTGNNIVSISVASATVVDNTATFSSAISALDPLTQYVVTVPRGSFRAFRPSITTSFCGTDITRPAGPQVTNEEFSFQINTSPAFALESYETCLEASGFTSLTSNIKLTFNKEFEINTGDVFANIYNSQGALHQQINLNGNFADDGNHNLVAVSGRNLFINPTKAFDSSESYYLQIDSGAIKDGVCDVIWTGINDTSTVTWETDGIRLTNVELPAAPTFGSILVDFEIPRPVKAGSGRILIFNNDTGELITTVNANDPGVRFSDTPYED